MKKDILFEVSTPIGFDVTVTSDWWNYIVKEYGANKDFL